MNRDSKPHFIFRWMRFNLVGMAGVVVQLATLHLLMGRLHIGYLQGTFLAVELTLLHNFLWHCLYTWRDRPAANARTIAGRLLRFHSSNGMVSLAGNAILMYLLVGSCGLPPLAANVTAVLACSLMNYLLGDRFVFLPE